MGTAPSATELIFLSTLPAWGATAGFDGQPGCDSTNFYPRSPRGERQNASSHYGMLIKFLSTLPAWGATDRLLYAAASAAISIHAPRVGSDEKVAAQKRAYYISIHAPRVGSDNFCSHRWCRK